MASAINYDDAIKYIEGIDDEVTRNLVSLSLRRLELLVIKGESPRCDFDLLFFVKSVEQTFCDRAVIRRVVDGDELTWPQA